MTDAKKERNQSPEAVKKSSVTQYVEHSVSCWGLSEHTSSYDIAKHERIKTKGTK